MKQLKEDGFTLVEILAAFVLLMIVLTSFASLFLSSKATNESSKKTVTATYTAQNIMEDITNRIKSTNDLEDAFERDDDDDEENILHDFRPECVVSDDVKTEFDDDDDDEIEFDEGLTTATFSKIEKNETIFLTISNAPTFDQHLKTRDSDEIEEGMLQIKIDIYEGQIKNSKCKKITEKPKVQFENMIFMKFDDDDDDDD